MGPRRVCDTRRAREAGQNGAHPRGYIVGPVTTGRLRGATLVDHGYSGLQPVVQYVAAFPHVAHRYVKVPLQFPR